MPSFQEKLRVSALKGQEIKTENTALQKLTDNFFLLCHLIS